MSEGYEVTSELTGMTHDKSFIDKAYQGLILPTVVVSNAPLPIA